MRVIEIEKKATQQVGLRVSENRIPWAIITLKMFGVSYALYPFHSPGEIPRAFMAPFMKPMA